MNHLFKIGPFEMFPETLKSGGKQAQYFRNKKFSQILHSATEGLKRLLFTENGEIILLICFGTGTMEAILMNCFAKENNLIVIDGDSFGHQYAQALDVHKIPHTAIKIDKHDILTHEMIDELLKIMNLQVFL